MNSDLWEIDSPFPLPKTNLSFRGRKEKEGRALGVRSVEAKNAFFAANAGAAGGGPEAEEEEGDLLKTMPAARIIAVLLAAALGKDNLFLSHEFTMGIPDSTGKLGMCSSFFFSQASWGGPGTLAKSTERSAVRARWRRRRRRSREFQRRSRGGGRRRDSSGERKTTTTYQNQVQ